MRKGWSQVSAEELGANLGHPAEARRIYGKLETSFRIFHPLDRDDRHPLVVAVLIMDDAPTQHLSRALRRDVFVVAEEALLERLTEGQALQQWMWGLPFGAKQKHYVE